MFTRRAGRAGLTAAILALIPTVPALAHGTDGRHATHLAGRAVLSQSVSLAGPQVDQVGVSQRSAPGSQRRGEVVNLGVSARRLRAALTVPAIDDPPRRAAADCA